MLWILQGEATFEALAGRDTSKFVMVKVIGAGMAFEIMSLFDGQARSLRGIASVPFRCALLSSAQLQGLHQAHPRVGVKLMAVICLNFSQSLRELTTKFKCHVQLNNVLHAVLTAGGMKVCSSKNCYKYNSCLRAIYVGYRHKASMNQA